MSTDSAAARRIDLDPLVHAKEKLYFGMSVIFSLAVYVFLVVTILSSPASAGVVIVYGIIFVIGYLIAHGLFIGHVRGNGIRVSERQFPELKALADAHARRLGMDETPAIFVLQSLGNMVIMALLFLMLTMLGRGWLVRWMTARPGRIARVTAAMLLTVGVFTVVYWTIRVPAIFGYGWFPTMPYNS